MRDRTVTDRPVMRWVPVVDKDGRNRLEAQWVVEPSSTPTAKKPHAA